MVNELNDLGNLYMEGIFSNMLNRGAKTAFDKTTDVPHKILSASSDRDPNGRFRKKGKYTKEPWYAKAYGAAERGIETLINLGKGVAGSALDEDMQQLKAKMYYIVLRQQPPVGTGFKKRLQQDIYNCKTVADLDQLASTYNVYWPWRKYKEYLMTRKH